MTGQSKAFSTQMTVKACGPLVMHKRQVILAILYIKLYRCANSFLFDQNLAIYHIGKSNMKVYRSSTWLYQNFLERFMYIIEIFPQAYFKIKGKIGHCAI